MGKQTVYLEEGSKRVIAGMLEWPGWCRNGKTEEDALATLLNYTGRYTAALTGAGLAVPQLESPEDLEVVERLPGTGTTDYGVPALIPAADEEPFDLDTFARADNILHACWNAFEKALKASEGKELQKGPRGGGRDQQKMAWHVIEAHHGYLRKIGWTHKLDTSISMLEELARTRQATQEGLTAAFNDELPKEGPRGGKMWPPRYFVRRAAWHILDHAWEIEDRVI